jgi:hypothetical protein
MKSDGASAVIPERRMKVPHAFGWLYAVPAINKQDREVVVGFCLKREWVDCAVVMLVRFRLTARGPRACLKSV